MGSCSHPPHFLMPRRIEELEEALRFYADYTNYERYRGRSYAFMSNYESPAEKDSGMIARAALKNKDNVQS